MKLKTRIAAVALATATLAGGGIAAATASSATPTTVTFHCVNGHSYTVPANSPALPSLTANLTRPVPVSWAPVAYGHPGFPGHLVYAPMCTATTP